MKHNITESCFRKFHLNKALGLLLLTTERELKAAENNVGGIFVIEANNSTVVMPVFKN